MKKNSKLTRNIAILALFVGMALAFLQGVHVYAAPEANGEAVVAQVETQEEGSVILYDEILPSAQYAEGTFPWWCYATAIGAALIGLSVYVFINKHTFS